MPNPEPGYHQGKGRLYKVSTMNTSLYPVDNRGIAQVSATLENRYNFVE
jgi:hypothetical protein